jgi:asparagine synthase (glutamine-hydrolysing)
MSNAAGSLVVTYNGEIYNFREVRTRLEDKGYQFHTQTDTEVILHAYAEWGVACLEQFNGMFAFALWDAPRRRLFVARDRFGLKPLLYYVDAQRFICASELKAILAAPGVSGQLNPVAVHHYLSLMTVPAPLTIYRQIHKLRPGHFLLVENGRVQEQRWWQLSAGRETREPEPVILEKLEAMLAEAVRLHLISDAPLGAFLSGGVDSSVVSALAARQTAGQPLKTFAVAFANQPAYDESNYARRVARHIGSQHTEIEVQANFLDILPDVVKLFDEPFAVSSALAVYLMARETAPHVKVILTGDGGDEVFAGYTHRHLRIDNQLDKLNRLPLTLFRRQNGASPQSLIAWAMPTRLRYLRLMAAALTTPAEIMRPWRYLQTLYTFNEAEKFALYTPAWAEHLRQSADFCSTDDFLTPAFTNSTPNRLAHWRYFDLHTTLADEMLTKVDKATMAWGLEARPPLLDHRLVEYALTLPLSLLARGTNGKRALKQVGERLVPPEVLYRPKHGFNVPLDAWLRSLSPSVLADALAPARVQTTGMFQPAVVNAIWQRHRRDRSVDFSNRLFVLAWYLMWQQHG